MESTVFILVAEGLALIGLLVGWGVRVSRTHTAVMTRFTNIENKLERLAADQARHAKEMADHACNAKEDHDAIHEIRARVLPHHPSEFWSAPDSHSTRRPRMDSVGANKRGS